MGDPMQDWSLGEYHDSVTVRADSLESDRFAQRLWQRDASLWSADPDVQTMISGALGWLEVGAEMDARIAEIDELAHDVREAGITDVVHMGMGGSSLAPLVLGHAFGPQQDSPALHVLDTTDPATVLGLDESLDLRRALFIEASKSGTTAEPLAFGAYFYGRLQREVGGDAGRHMLTITDPGSPLVGQSEARAYRRVVLNFPDIGGRFSALSYFGLLPAGLVGIDVANLLGRANAMAETCRNPVVRENAGVLLGAALGELALRGRDKLTLITPAPIATFGMWLEQLIAESTGKEGKGVLPVAGEALGPPSVYGDDRVFVALELDDPIDKATQDRLDALSHAGHPVIRIPVGGPADLGAEFFRWEIATATIGAILGINPFDQPNVQESKTITNGLLAQVRETGDLPRPERDATASILGIYGSDGPAGHSDALASLFESVRPGDYVALQAYLTESSEIDAALDNIRLRIRDGLHVATTVGYGPRFLHSTGQFHKGGPDSGIFLQLTAANERDAPIPGQPYGFGTLKEAQELGDIEALWAHGRRALRIDLGSPAAGLADLDRRIDAIIEVNGA